METESAISVGEVKELQLVWKQYVEKSRNVSACWVKMLEEFISPDAVITVLVVKCKTFLSLNLNLNAEYGTFHH